MNEYYECPNCEGNKTTYNDDGYGNLLEDTDCFYMDGTPTGYTPKIYVSCYFCGGTGKVSRDDIESWHNYDPNER